MDRVQKMRIDQVKRYGDILMEELLVQQEKAKAEFKKELSGTLGQIKEKLMALLAENEQVTDIERLERDEFIIDVARKEKVENEGEKECDEIRKEAEKTVLRLQLLRERVKQSTWDKMEVQQKAVKSIQSDTIIFNYPIRIRTAAEKRRLNQIISARRIELKEKIMRYESKLKEGLDQEEFSKFIEDYIMNRARGKPEFLDDESIQEAAKEFAIKDAEKKAKRDKMEANLNI